MRKNFNKLIALSIGLLLSLAVAQADWYEATGKPAARSLLNSADMRSEFASIDTDISDKLPALTGNGDKLVVVNSAGTALTVASAGLTIGQGGTGATTAAGARTSLGVAIGSDVQAWDADLDALAALADTDSNFIVGNGSAWIVENGATARASMGANNASNLTTGALADARLSSNVALIDAANVFTGNNRMSTVAPPLWFVETDAGVDNGNWLLRANGESFGMFAVDDAEATFNPFLSVDRTGATVDLVNISGTNILFNGADLAVTFGGTGSGTAAGARTNLGTDDAANLTSGELADARLSSNVPLLDSINTFTERNTFQSTAAVIRLDETDASANNGHWQIRADVEGFRLRAYDDAFSSNSTFFEVERTANTIDSMALTANVLTWGGNTLFTTANDGASSGLDADLLDGVSSAAFLQAANNLSDLGTASTARTNLGVAIGSDVQAYDADLTAIAALADTDSNFIVGNGAAWVVESGATARTSLGLGSLATASTISNTNWSGTDLAVANGGTGASDAATARANLDAADLEVEINTQNANYTLVAGDSGGAIYKASGGAGETITIPANASVAYDVGTVVTIINNGTGDLSIAITTDTMILAGDGSTGTRTLADHGMATIIKVASTTWFISGVGVT